MASIQIGVQRERWPSSLWELDGTPKVVAREALPNLPALAGGDPSLQLQVGARG